MAEAPGGGGGTSNAFPIAVIVLLAVFALYQQDNRGSGSGGAQGVQKASESQFILEMNPAAQETETGQTADFVVRYENASNRVLDDAIVRVILPPGAELDFIGSEEGWHATAQNGAEYSLGRIFPGEEGSIAFSENISGGKRNTIQETTVVAVWEEAPSTWKRRTAEEVVAGQAVVRASVLPRASLAARDGSIGEGSRTGGAKGSLAALASSNSKSVVLPIVGWAFFLYVFGGITFLVVRTVGKIRKEARKNVAEAEEAARRRRRWEEFEEEKEEMKESARKEIEGARTREDANRPLRGEPPENLPI